VVFHSWVVCRARASARAWYSSRGRMLRWQRDPLVHNAFAEQARQVLVDQDTTIASVSR